MSIMRIYIGHNIGDEPMSDERVLTAIKNASAARSIDALTLIPATGMWLGELEQSTIVEVCNPLNSANVYLMAIDLAKTLEQECVGVAYNDRFELVYPNDELAPLYERFAS